MRNEFSIAANTRNIREGVLQPMEEGGKADALQVDGHGLPLECRNKALLDHAEDVQFHKVALRLQAAAVSHRPCAVAPPRCHLFTIPASDAAVPCVGPTAAVHPYPAKMQPHRQGAPQDALPEVKLPANRWSAVSTKKPTLTSRCPSFHLCIRCSQHSRRYRTLRWAMRDKGLRRCERRCQSGSLPDTPSLDSLCPLSLALPSTST